MSRGAGDRTLGEYELLSLLGRGAAGEVFLARRSGDQAAVAVKVLHDGDPRALERFRREADVLARLRHPSIVSVLAHGVAAGRPYLVLEYCPGVTLKRQLETRGRLRPVEAARGVHQLATALDHAHSRGVVHRDVKPANVILDFRAGRARLVDFGVAHDDEGLRLTRTGDVVGTPLYMAPEQLRGERATDPRLDVYALGAILYQCLTGQPPYSAGSAVELALKQETPPAPPRSLVPEVPAALERICLEALAADPERRLPSARAFAEALARFLEAPEAPELALHGRRSRWRSLGVVAAVSALALVGWVAIERGPAELGRPPASSAAPPPPGAPPGVARLAPPPPSAPASQPLDRAPDDRVERIERRLAVVVPFDDRPEEPQGWRDFLAEAYAIAQDFPTDVRAQRLRAIARLLDGGDELEARRELAIHASAEPAAGELVRHWAGRLSYALGFERAAYDTLVAPAESSQATASLRLSALLLLLRCAPPVRDPALALTLAETLVRDRPAYPAPFLVHGLRSDVLLALERREEAAAAYEEAGRLVPQRDLAAHFEDKASLTRDGSLGPDEAGRKVPLVLPIGRRLRQLAELRGLADGGATELALERLEVLAAQARERRDLDGAALWALHAARAQRDLGRADAARASLARAFEEARMGDLRALVGRELALALLERSEEGDARRVEALVTTDDPALTPGERVDAWVLLARARVVLGRREEARAALERARVIGARDRRELEAVLRTPATPR